MNLLKDHRTPASANPVRQSRKPGRDQRRRHWVWGAISSGVLIATACELITPLDFGGNAKPSYASDAGRDADGGNIGGGGSSTIDECKPGCVNNHLCMAGICTCLESQTECNGSCIESLQDAGYCGACGITCRADQMCKGGKCACPAGQTECDEACIESLQDAGYCSACGVTCRADQICGDTSCGCRQGETECGASCVNMLTDSQHCGACESKCQSGQTCVNGNCKSSPCDGLCTNLEVISATSEGFRIEPLGSTERCVAIEGYTPNLTNPRIVCWNLDTSARPLRVNGQPVSCVPDAGVALPQQNLGWYCIQVGAGADTSAGLLLPTK